jgi:hypothetical protein
VADISKDCGAFIFRVKQPQKEVLRLFETSVIIHQSTRQNVQQELNIKFLSRVFVLCFCKNGTNEVNVSHSCKKRQQWLSIHFWHLFLFYVITKSQFCFKVRCFWHHDGKSSFFRGTWNCAISILCVWKLESLCSLTQLCQLTFWRRNYCF